MEARRERGEGTAQPVELRRAEMRDVDGLAAFEELVFHDEPHRISRRQWRYLVERPSGEVAVADGGGEILGVLVLNHRRGSPNVHVHSIGVHPGARRRGIARLLLRRAEAFARRAGAQRLILEVRRDNRAAIGLYQTKGYEADAVLPSYYGIGEDGLRMVRRLA
jgi:ribosomal protein S18 acetylase RimI-like enzyme